MESYLQRLEEWNDDDVCSALFSAFQQREDNPEAFDYKISFWHRQIAICCNQQLLIGTGSRASKFSFSLSSLYRSFSRNGLHPLDLATVVRIGVEAGLYVSRDEEQRASFASSVVKRVQKLFSWLRGFGDADGVSQGDEFVVVSVLEDFLQLLVPWLAAQERNLATDHVLTAASFKELLLSFQRLSDDDLELIVRALERKKVIQSIKDGAIFLPNESVQLDSSVLSDIASVKIALERLAVKEAELEDSLRYSRETATVQLTKCRSAALLALKKSKTIALSLEECRKSVLILEKSLVQIEEALAKNSIMGALSQSTKVFIPKFSIEELLRLQPQTCQSNFTAVAEVDLEEELRGLEQEREARLLERLEQVSIHPKGEPARTKSKELA